MSTFAHKGLRHLHEEDANSKGVPAEMADKTTGTLAASRPVSRLEVASPSRRRERIMVEARAAELIAEEMTLRELRQARKPTQVKMAKTLGVTEDKCFAPRKRSDLLLSTLLKTIHDGIDENDRRPKPTSRRHVS